MNLTTLGWYITVLGLLLGFITVMMSLVWHKIDNKADHYLTIAKQFWSEGNKEDGSEWHLKSNRMLAMCHIIHRVGAVILYAAAILTLLGCLFLAIGSKP